MSGSRRWGAVIAIWLAIPALLMKTGMSLMSIFNTRFVSENVDGIPVSSFNEIAQTEYLQAFQLLGLAHLPGIAFGFVAAIWLRSLLPLATGLLVVEALARRVLLGHNPLLWLTEGPAVGINFVLLVMLFAAFLASMAERMSQAGRG